MLIWVALAASDIGLRDHPVATAGGTTFLDGASWTASTTLTPGRVGACSFKADTDFNAGVSGPSAASSSKNECCEMCRAQSACAGAVLAKGVCWFKTKGDLTKPSIAKGREACILPAAGPGHPLSIKATVPGDLLTDLELAGQIGDPLYELNFQNASIWDANVWTYTTTFGIDASTLAGDATSLLVFDGIKMGATIELDGHVVGVATDQWLRYSFPISKMLSPAASHELSVTFDNAINTHGRYMGCRGGWGPRDRLSHCQLTPIHLWGCKED